MFRSSETLPSISVLHQAQRVRNPTSAAETHGQSIGGRFLRRDTAGYDGIQSILFMLRNT